MNSYVEDDQRLAELMRLAQQGDATAYIRLLTQITPRLRNAVRHKRPFLQPQDVDDLVQNILLALHSVRMTYDSCRPFLPWLMAIARNQIADGTRRYARRTANEIAVEHVPETFSDDETNIHEHSYGDPEALKIAIDTLPIGQRRAVEMLSLKEMTMKEAAAASGMSIPALKVSVHRAKRTLRKALAGKV